ncbi:endoprotease bli-like [Gigantopelta aegis]|uniref:endoprotease bli-like n=1 Tax=Gigantopelta aegis TaxID=1735272 RepID=UPI001B88C0BB|nr:endoprotease bli-like [Gigantopelta aegis]
MKILQLFTIVVLSIWLCVSTEDGHFVNKFAISLRADVRDADNVVQDIATSLGFTVEHKLESINVYVLSHPRVSHRSRRSADHHVNSLKTHPKILHAQQEIELIREKREIIYDKQLELPIREISDPSVYHRIAAPRLTLKDEIPRTVVEFRDPFYKDQWYINNVGQSGGKVGLDLNVMIAWQNNINGTGVVVCILDDGVDHGHLDLVDNYDPKASMDFNDLTDKKKDPMPNKMDPHNSHGTRCAGEIASKAGNNVCGVGVAFGARIGGVRILDGTVTDSLEAASLNFNINYIDIFSASWGPTDDGKTMDAPKHFAALALEHGAKFGRGGKGTLYAWATGNGGHNHDDCGADGYVSSIYTMSFGSSTDMGRRPYFMENCTSTLAVVPCGGEEVKGEEKLNSRIKLKVVTTDVDNKCIENFQGTSSAAPLAAGCLALILQANAALTWRDMQHIVVRGSRIPSVDTSWVINGAHLHVSHSFGFGVMDCGEMVRLALDWQMVPQQHMCYYTRQGIYKEIPGQGYTEDYIYVYDGCVNDAHSGIDRLEHVQISIKVDHHRRGDIQIFLTSPSGTRSEMLSPRSNDASTAGLDFTFMTVHCWMEQPRGVWRLEVHSNSGSSERHISGTLIQWKLVLYGTMGYTFNEVSARHVPKQVSAESLTDQLTKLMVQEEQRSRLITLRRSSDASFQKKALHSDRPQGLGNVDRGLQDLASDLSVVHGKLTKRLFGNKGAEGNGVESSDNTLSNRNQYVEEESLSNRDLDGVSDDELIEALLRVLDDDSKVEDKHVTDDSIKVKDKHIRNIKTLLKKQTQYSRKSTSNSVSENQHSYLNTKHKQTDSVKKSLEKLMEFLKTQT